MDDTERLLKRLRDEGVDEEAIARAARQGRLATLAVEAALGGKRRHTLTAVARAAGLAPAYLRTLLQAIGRPNPSRGERGFTDEDIELARIVRRLLDAGLPREDIVEAARVMGQNSAQVAEAVRRLVGNALIEPGDSDQALGLRYAQAAEELAPLLPALLDLNLRAHLREGIRRELITESERREGRLSDTREVAVAFADLVGYTDLGSDLAAAELGSIAGRFGKLAVDAVRAPVQLVKMVGDAAMLVSPEVAPMLKTLVDVRDRVDNADPELPDVHIGVAYGPATQRVGDWFGATVNLASRITDAAKPGQLLAEQAVCQAVDGDWKRRRKLRLKGVEGRVRLFSYEPSG
ncbi:MAG: adenylate cyclase regulatory domain-containing protein [Solirubrobacteraceae bacterium]|jgi:adenylate cyclase